MNIDIIYDHLVALKQMIEEIVNYYWINNFIHGIGENILILENPGDFIITLCIMDPKKLMIYYNHENQIYYHFLSEQFYGKNFEQLLLQEEKLKRIYHFGHFVDKNIAFQINPNVEQPQHEKILLITEDQQIHKLTVSSLDITLENFRTESLNDEDVIFLYKLSNHLAPIDTSSESKLFLREIIEVSNENQNMYNCYIR